MVEYRYVYIKQRVVYLFNGPQLDFAGATLESVIFGGNQVGDIGGAHGVRESPNGLYTNDTMRYLLGQGLGNSGRVALVTEFAIVSKVHMEGWISLRL